MKIDRICANKSCRVHFPAKAADVKRGWGLFCSKRCKAIKQTQRIGDPRERVICIGFDEPFDNTTDCQNSDPYTPRDR